MDSRSPAERSLQARIAACHLHARIADPTAFTAPARTAFLARFDREADPDGVLSPQERTRRAELLRTAYFSRLALKSAQARRRRVARHLRGRSAQDPREAS